MIFVDTNYFLRFLLEDNKNQAQEAIKLFEEASTGAVKLTTSIIVFFEIYWVLTSFYKTQKMEIVRVLHGIVDMTFVEMDDRDIVEQAVEIFSKSTFDLEDAYNIAFAKRQSVTKFCTFDKNILQYLKK